MFKQTGTIAFYTFVEALRNRMFQLLLLVAVAAFGFSLLLAQISVTESLQVKNAFLAATFRLSAVFMLSAFIIVSIVREAADKTSEFFLSFPMPRASYFLGKLAGYTLCAVIFALFLSLPLLWKNSALAVCAWGCSLFMELTLMAALSLFCAIMLNLALPALTVIFGFYLLSRTMGVLILLGNGPLANHGPVDTLIERTIETISFLLPRFDLYTKSSWLIYSPPSWHEFAPIVLQTLVYLLLVSSAALFDLYRKNL